MTQLKRLWISNTSLIYNREAMKELNAALPDTKIITTGEPTKNGWRVGEHYETIYEIFHTDQYKPFLDSYPVEGEEVLQPVPAEETV